MSIREITEDDLPAIVALLTEGFPRRRPGYWRRGLENMRHLPHIPGYPRYGYLLEENGAAQGVLLVLGSLINGTAARANASAWYVREDFRTKAGILYRSAITEADGLHVNFSPATHVVRITRAFGFRPYTEGVCLIDASAALRRSHGWRLTRYVPQLRGDLPALTADLAERHVRYGCTVLLLDNGTAPVELVVYRLKLIKGVIPCAQLLHGTPEHVLAACGPLMRHLLTRGLFLALVDIGETTKTFGFRRFPGRNVRYAKGGTPEIGDLLDSEYALFGP
jgi:hypothetical protein